MNEKGIAPPHGLEIDEKKQPKFLKWLNLLWAAFPKVNTYSVTINPTSVPANSEDVQTFAVTGLTTKDIVTVNKPTNTAGLDLVQCWVSAADTLSIKFRNQTGAPIDPGSEVYLVCAVRR